MNKYVIYKVFKGNYIVICNLTENTLMISEINNIINDDLRFVCSFLKCFEAYLYNESIYLKKINFEQYLKESTVNIINNKFVIGSKYCLPDNIFTIINHD